MKLKQKKLSNWFRTHKWSVENRGTYHVYLSKDDAVVTIDACVFKDKAKICSGGFLSLTANELRKIAEFTDFCNEELEEYRHQKE